MNQTRIVKIFLIVMVVLYIVGTSYGGLMRDDVCFKLTESSFQGLQKDGIPETVVDNLKSLQNKEFYSEDKFLGAVQDIIEEEQLTQHNKKLILKHATQDTQDTVQDLKGRLPEFFTQHLERYLKEKLPEVWKLITNEH